MQKKPHARVKGSLSSYPFNHVMRFGKIHSGDSRRIFRDMRLTPNGRGRAITIGTPPFTDYLTSSPARLSGVDRIRGTVVMKSLALEAVNTHRRGRQQLEVRHAVARRAILRIETPHRGSAAEIIANSVRLRRCAPAYGGIKCVCVWPARDAQREGQPGCTQQVHSDRQAKGGDRRSPAGWKACGCDWNIRDNRICYRVLNNSNRHELEVKR